MDIVIKSSKHNTWGKCNVTGECFTLKNGASLQEHLETIYYLGKLRIIVKHDLKFLKRNLI